MADYITKILVRQGTDVQRRAANVVGVVFNTGEPAFCTDTKRLYIGDGVTPGGISTATKNLGSVNQLFGTYQNGLTFDAITLINSTGASPGDFLYDKATRNIYSLSSVNTFPPQSSEFVKYDTIVQANPDQMQLINGVLNIKQGGVKKENLDFSVVDGTTLVKSTITDPLKVKLNGITNAHLAQAPAFTFKCNPTNTLTNVQDIVVADNQFIGRSSGSALTAIPMTRILQNSGLSGGNGISVNTSIVPTAIKLNSDYFTITPFPGNKIAFEVPAQCNSGLVVNGAAQVNSNLTVTGGLTVAGGLLVGNITSSGTLNVSSISTNIITPTNPFLTITKSTVINNGGITINGTGYVNALTGNSNNITGATNVNGNVVVTGGMSCTLNSSVQGSCSIGGNLTVGNAAPGAPLITALIYGTVQAKGDIIAYYNPSDSRLKTNLVQLNNSLEKISSLKGYEFEFNNKASEVYRGRTSYGLLAEDVVKVYPHVVQTREEAEDGSFYLGVDYAKLVPILIEAIKELKQEVDNLKNKKSCSNNCH